MNKHLPIVLIVLLCIAAIVFVCRPRKPNRGTVPAFVTITYKGSPVAEASVSLLSDDGKYAVGTTDVKGTATLFTFEPGDGAMPGVYRVAVDKHETIFPDAPASAAEDTGRQAGKIRHIYHVPAKYTDTKTSDLSVEVIKGEANRFTFELND